MKEKNNFLETLSALCIKADNNILALDKYCEFSSYIQGHVSASGEKYNILMVLEVSRDPLDQAIVVECENVEEVYAENVNRFYVSLLQSYNLLRYHYQVADDSVDSLIKRLSLTSPEISNRLLESKKLLTAAFSETGYKVGICNFKKADNLYSLFTRISIGADLTTEIYLSPTQSDFEW